jgi:uncharacterized protein YjiS (DUF1127 family)
MAALLQAGIVQVQHVRHVTPNSATERCRETARGLRDMAYVNTTRVARKGLLDRLVAAKDAVATSIQTRRVYLRTVEELNSLTDRELSDLGISRLGIPDIAREAAYGK